MELRDLLNALINIDGILVVLICTKSGRVKEDYINEDEFNKSKIGVNVSLLYKSAMEMCELTGVQEPVYNLISSPGYNILLVNIGRYLLFILCQDTTEIEVIYQVTNMFMNKLE